MQSRAQWYSIHGSQSASQSPSRPSACQGHLSIDWTVSYRAFGPEVVVLSRIVAYTAIYKSYRAKISAALFAACFPSIDIRQPSPQLRDPTVSKLPIGECIRLVLAPGPETQQATKMSLWEIKGRGMRTYKLFDAGGKRGAGERAVIT